MCGRLTGADNTAGFLACRGFGLRPGVNDEQKHRPSLAHGLPAVALWMGIMPTNGQKVIENQTRGFEAQSVVSSVGAVLCGSPDPGHAIPRLNVIVPI